MKQINLYQAAFRPPSIALPARSIALSGAVLLAGLLALYVWDDSQLRQLREQAAKLSRHADALTRQVEASAPGARQADPALAVEASALEARLRALQSVQEAISAGKVGSEVGYSAQFRALARTAVTGAWLTDIALFDNGRAMELRGRALSGADAARLIGNLRREPLFVGLSFTGLQVGPPEAESVVQAGAETAQPATYLEFSLMARPLEASSSVGLKVEEQR